jgi:hypothetical protein
VTAELLYADGQMDVHDEDKSIFFFFCNFARSPENEIFENRRREIKDKICHIETQSNLDTAPFSVTEIYSSLPALVVSRNTV